MGYTFRLENQISSIENPDGTGQAVDVPCKVLWTGREGYQIAPLGLAFLHSEIDEVYINGVLREPVDYTYGAQMAALLQKALNSNTFGTNASTVLVVDGFAVVGGSTVQTETIYNSIGAPGASFLFTLVSLDPASSVVIEFQVYDQGTDTYFPAGTIATIVGEANRSVSAIGIVALGAASTGDVVGLSMPLPAAYRFSVTESTGENAILNVTANYF